MKRLLAGAIAAGLLVAAAPAPAATPTERKIATLQKQVRTLQRDVRTLRRQVREANQLAAVAAGFAICNTAITADALQATWQVIDQVAGRAIFGPQQAVSDPICREIQVPRPQAVPPTISPFTALLRLVNRSSASLALG